MPWDYALPPASSYRRVEIGDGLRGVLRLSGNDPTVLTLARRVLDVETVRPKPIHEHPATMEFLARLVAGLVVHDRSIGNWTIRARKAAEHALPRLPAEMGGSPVDAGACLSILTDFGRRSDPLDSVRDLRALADWLRVETVNLGADVGTALLTTWERAKLVTLA